MSNALVDEAKPERLRVRERGKANDLGSNKNVNKQMNKQQLANQQRGADGVDGWLALANQTRQAEKTPTCHCVLNSYRLVAGKMSLAVNRISTKVTAKKNPGCEQRFVNSRVDDDGIES